MSLFRLCVLAFTFACALLGSNECARAHEVRPALLQITEKSDGHYEVLWKQPTVGSQAVRLVPHISDRVLAGTPSSVEGANSFQVTVWRDLRLPGGLNGRRIAIEGLERTITDVMVLITMSDGRQQQAMLHPASPSMTIDVSQSGIAVWAYLTEGVKHILTGADHLSFVLGLMLLVRNRMNLVKAVTAFTAAHSITLAATSLELVQVSASVIEPPVALSIVFIAVEVVRSYQQRPTLTARYPWIVAFAFGLLHGFAFAGALRDIGLPQDAVGLALFLFNVGVEAGQLLFIGAVLAVGWGLRSVPFAIPSWTRWVAPYAIGSLAVVWLLERTTAALQAPAAY